MIHHPETNRKKNEVKLHMKTINMDKMKDYINDKFSNLSGIYVSQNSWNESKQVRI